MEEFFFLSCHGYAKQSLELSDSSMSASKTSKTGVAPLSVSLSQEFSCGIHPCCARPGLAGFSSLPPPFFSSPFRLFFSVAGS